MSRWIDFDFVKSKKRFDKGKMKFIVWMQDIYHAPSIDLVRCGECRYCTLDIVVQRRTDGYEKTVNLCRNPKHSEEWSVPKDWYCADGERKESEVDA